MASYKIIENTVEVKNGKMTTFDVIFTKTDGTKSAQQYYEVYSIDKDVIYAQLDEAARAFDKLGVLTATAPALETGVEKEVLDAVEEGDAVPETPPVK